MLFGGLLVFEHHAVDLPSQSLSQPGVLDDGQFEALAAQHRVVIGVDGAAHSLDDDQVSVPLPHQSGQTFIQAAAGKKRRLE